MKRFLIPTAIALIACAGSVDAATEIQRAVFGCGGGDATSATHGARSTLGQTLTGEATSGTLGLSAGFWTGFQIDTDVADGQTLPGAFRLHQNVPNPFNPYTTIRYDVPERGGWVSLCIYNTPGRLVRTLVDRHESPGEKRVDWDGHDDRGSRVSTGIYLCVMEAPSYTSTWKMTLLR